MYRRERSIKNKRNGLKYERSLRMDVATVKVQEDRNAFVLDKMYSLYTSIPRTEYCQNLYKLNCSTTVAPGEQISFLEQ